MTTGKTTSSADSDIAAPADNVIAVSTVLMSLRKRSGLRSGRIQKTSIDIRSLLRLSVVRRYAHLDDITPEAALLVALRHAGCKLDVTDRLIVDSELCLGLFDADPPPGIDLDRLYDKDLQDRRRYLTLHWSALHEALGATEIPTLRSVRAIRDAPERRAFLALATLLTSESDPEAADRQTVTIIGDAVMDMIVEVDAFPRPGVDMWGDFRRSPGGKGLKRAVALAGLGLDTRLFTAIGQDSEGKEIRDYLAKQGVDTSLVKMMPGASTPVTIAIETDDGTDSSYIAAKVGRTQLTAADFDSASNLQAISDVKAVLLTFEQSVPVIERTLEVVGTQKEAVARSKAPWLIVNVRPQRPLTHAMKVYLSAIDYLVGSPDELAALRPDLSPDAVVSWLLRRGVGAVCVLERSRCTVHRADVRTQEVSRFANPLPVVAGAASAFLAALTYRVVTRDGDAETDDFEWATAAMADLIWRVAQAPRGRSVADTLSSPDRIDAIVAGEPDADAPRSDDTA
ncbi:carbohydrate kinase family protein [Nocardia sp. NPDC059240]|uniref:carbohydrate kinase family protein n=1 Tax=Nocardia sp. NPDC059240 TaxID=3346786 RepID=UPI00368F6B96